MIELEQIKTTDTLGNIRPLINTAFSEIQNDQPFVGRAVNPSAEIYKLDGTLVSAVTASNFHININALCFPENNGVYIARLFGSGLMAAATEVDEWGKIVIDIPAISLATRGANISTFVSPKHLGLVTGDVTDSTATVFQMCCFQQKTFGVYQIEEHDNTCNVTITPFATERPASKYIHLNFL